MNKFFNTTAVSIILIVLYVAVLIILPKSISQNILAGIAGWYVGFDLVPRLSDKIVSWFNNKNT